MKEIKIILPLVLFLLIIQYSCKQAEDRSQADFESIRINPKDINPEKYFSISKISNKVEYIPIETRNDVVFGEITQIEFRKGRYYILDKIGKSIYIFNGEGKFLSKIRNIGKGPGEYLSISSFAVDKSQVYIHDDRKQIILVYDSLGKFLYEDKTTLIFNDFYFINKEHSYIYLGTFDNSNRIKTNSSNLNRLIFRKNAKIVKMQLPFKYDEKLRQYPEMTNHFSSFQDTISFIDGLDNFVYRINEEGNISKRFFVDFGEYYFPIEDRMKYNGKRSSLDFCKMTKFIETPTIILINYSHKNRIYSFIYSKKSKNSLNTVTSWLNDLKYIPISSASNLSVQDSSLLGYVDAKAFKNVFNQHNTLPSLLNLKEMNERILDSDNPILVKISIKDF
jgi:hypothetical protein